MPDLSRVSEREALKVKRNPHWHRLRPGCYLGYRPSPKNGPGTWVARAYDQETQGYRYKSLGSLSDDISRERFAKAKEEAEEFARIVELGGLTDKKLDTVEDACRRFADQRDEVAARFRRYVYSDPIAKIRLVKLRRSHVAAWRARVDRTPALVSRRKEGRPVTRPRSPATLNRDMATFRTALAMVLPLGPPNTEAAWQEALKPVKNAVKRRTLYLTHEQRLALVQAVGDEAEPFVRALCLLPLRPGAVASLTVADFDKRTGELTIMKDKAGRGRRLVVSKAAATQFSEAAKGKQSDAPLLSRANGKAWDRFSWRDPISEAAAMAKLPPNVTAYTLRHSTITDLVRTGLPLLTVAQISGTSVEMIERHYGHLVRGAAVEALETLSL